MTTKSIRYALLSILAGIGLTACVDQPFEDMHVEMFNRDFIKEFGAIDPNQDWNMATSADVKVNIGDRADAHVKMYAKCGQKYYLVADLKKMTGEFTVPIDVPKDTKDILVKVDDAFFEGVIPGAVDCTGAPTSRAVLSDDGTASTSTTSATHIGSTYTVAITKPETFEYFNAQQIAPITSTENWTKYLTLNKEASDGQDFRTNDVPYDGFHPEKGNGILPESGQPNRKYSQRPSDEDGYHTYDFTLKMTKPEIGFDLFPYYYGTNKEHDMFVYLVDKATGRALEPIDANGDPVDPANVTDENEGLYKPKLYPVFRDQLGDDIESIKRPFTNLQGVAGLWVYEYIEREPVEPNSFENIGKYITSVSAGGTLTLAPNQKIWLFPIVKAKYNNTDYTTSGVPLEEFLRCTTLPRMQWATAHGSDGDKLWYDNEDELFHISKRGLAFIGSDRIGDSHNLVVAVQDYDNNEKEYNMGTSRYANFNIKIENGGLKLPYEVYPQSAIDAAQVAYIDNAKTDEKQSNIDYADIIGIINQKNSSGNHYETELDKWTDTSKLFDDFLYVYYLPENPLYGKKLLVYGDNSSMSYYPIPSNTQYDLQWVTSASDNNWYNIGFRFISKAQKTTVTPSSKTSTPSFHVYSSEVIKDILGSPSEKTGWTPATVKYDPYRPVGEETSSYYTEIPMLCRTHGYTIRIYDKNNTNNPYQGLIGIALRNTYKENFDTDASGEYNVSSESSVWHEFYTYSQSRYNDWKYDNTSFFNARNPYNSGSTLNKQIDRRQASNGTFYHNYAVRIIHPMSGREFFAFEDWEISKVANGDKYKSTYLSPTVTTFSGDYSNYDYSKHSGDYSSDRDYNDLIFRVERAELVDDYGKGHLQATEERIPWIWVLEDLGANGDYDFNDVIIRITSVTTKTPVDDTDEDKGFTYSKCVTFQPICAGGTLETYIHLVVDYDENNSDNIHDYKDYCLAPGEWDLSVKLDGAQQAKDVDGNIVTIPTRRQDAEYHNWFGVDDFTSMINTGAGPTVYPNNIKRCVMMLPTTFRLNPPDTPSTGTGTTLDAYQHPFYIMVFNTIDPDNNTYGNGENGALDREWIRDQTIKGELEKEFAPYTVTLPDHGWAPQSFLIAGSQWHYAKEYEHILNAYPKFKYWVKDHTNTGWIAEPVESYLWHFNWGGLMKGASALAPSSSSNSSSGTQGAPQMGNGSTNQYSQLRRRN